MAGANISVEVDDKEVQRAMKRLTAVVGNPQVAFADIGEYLILSHYERWGKEQAPDGTPWAELKPETTKQKRKKGKPLDILAQDGYLRDLMRYNPSPSGLEFGTDRKYGATHQFGDDDRGIPARPFLGLSDADQIEVVSILQDHLRSAIKG